jgi:hypothetical protein
MKLLNKITLFVPLALIALVIWAVANTGGAAQKDIKANLNCNIENMRGSYAYAAFGTIGANPAGFPVGAYNSAATLVMDGAGNYTVNAKSSYGGMIVDETFVGTYSVDDGCGVTFVYQNVPSVYAVFTNNRSESRGIFTIPGMNISGLTVRK